MKALLRRLRTSQPVNSILTSSVRGFLKAAHLRSEFIIGHLPRVGTVSAALPNGRILCLRSAGDDWISNQVYWRGWEGYEPGTSSLIFRLAKEVRVFVDVGVHVGFYALLAGHANLGSRVYAFEPLPQTYQRLEQNVRLNGLANVSCIAAALGDDNGHAELYCPGDGIPCSASLSAGLYQASLETMRRVTVPILTLDAFVESSGVARVDLMKMDTEGTAPQVLRGAIGLLRRDRPRIVCEVLREVGTGKDLESILGPLGYQYYLLTSEGPVQQATIEGDPVHLNYLFSVDGCASS